MTRIKGTLLTQGKISPLHFATPDTPSLTLPNLGREISGNDKNIPFGLLLLHTDNFPCLMRFVALDLETTGLDPNTDTIIEVAAISFSLEQDADGMLQITNQDERTMLVNPGRELKEEVTMITGISSAMLEGKPTWKDIRERIASFIGDAVIIGHNVLFDVKMLGTHGIDFTEHTIIDTFELAELFSQEAESLNLGFLSGIYGLQAGEMEHRALGDTRLSVALLLKYLHDSQNLSVIKQSILRLMGKKEEKKSIRLFNELIGIAEGDVFVPKYEKERKESSHDKERYPGKSEFCFSMSGNREEEIDLLLSLSEKHGHIAILTPNKKVQAELAKTLTEHGCKTSIAIEPSRFCSLEEVVSMIEDVPVWERKMNILMGKLLLWLQDSETGLLEELNFYGDEREYIQFFRAEEDEYSLFRHAYDEKKKGILYHIYDMGDFLRNPPREKIPCVVVKDIPLFEDMVRKTGSTHIHIGDIAKDLRCFPNIKNLLYTLYLVGDIYEHIPKRPTGENQFPPGDFGETYFFLQETLWSEKGKWLVLFSSLLAQYHNEWKATRKIHTRKESIQSKNIDKALDAIVQYGLYRKANIGTIIHIREGETHIHFIPRNVAKRARKILSDINTEHLISYGYNIDGPLMKRFLPNECGIFDAPKKYIETTTSKKHLKVENAEITFSPGTVILTTSQKHIREIGKSLKGESRNILIQGISGGKGKMLSLFMENPENSVLVGLIDTWKDEYTLWERAKNIIIAKLPFDPPSDPYFLARTVGMSDNFTHYSEPMAIIRINTLIGRIRGAGYRGDITCLDGRLEKTLWGKEIREEIL